MTTIKSHTDVQQSKKLAEILPIESADMRYAPFGDIHPWFIEGKLIEKDSVPCWSLAALLDILPIKLRIALCINDDFNDIRELRYAITRYAIGSVETNDYDCYADNPVDACYKMILKLHKQNLL